MMKSLVRHLPHYLPLLGLFFTGILAFVLFSYDQAFQMIVAIAVAVFYVVWGIIHHAIHKDLYLAVVIEYLAVASLGLTIVFSLIIRT